MLQFQPFEITDFSGGLTDNFIGREKSFSKSNRNFYITVDKKLSYRPGSLVDGANDTQGKISAGVEYLATPFTTSEKPFKLTTNSNLGKFFYYNGSTHAELTGPTGNSLFTTAHGAASDHKFSVASWNNHLYVNTSSFTEKVQKVFEDGSAVLQLRTAGLPKPSGTAPTINGTTGSTNSYLYALVWKYTYTVGGQTFISRSSAYRGSFTANAAPTSITPAANMAIGNSTSDNYDTASSSLVLEYYRSIANGLEYYLVGTVTNTNCDGAHNITDSVSDANLLLNQVIYTSGGVSENDPPPQSKYVHITERGVALYAYCLDGSDTIKNRFRQSKVGVPDACPARFFADVDDDATGVSSYRGLPLLFSRKNVYRGDGLFDSFGQGGLTPTKIADFVGSVSHNGIVQTYFGVFFAGDTGFYWTNGYEVTKISEELPTSYATAYPTDSAKAAITGCYDPINQLVFWTFSETTNSDAIFVLHLRFGIKPNSVFTTWGGNTATGVSSITTSPATVPTTVSQNFRAKHLLSFNQQVYRADNRGYTMIFSANQKNDPRVDTASNISAWGTTYLYYDYQTPALNFDNELIRKWTPKVLLTLKNVGNVSLQLNSDRDLKNQFKSMREIKERSAFNWADPGILWGDPVIYSSDQVIYEEKRMLRVPGIRCTYRVFQLTNSFTVIQKSDNLGLGTVAHSAKTVVLVTGSNSWPADILDYYITFATDNYVNHYLITASDGTTLTYSDAAGASPDNGDYKWMIRGFAKTDSIYLQSIKLPFAYLTPSQTGFRTGTEGFNA